MVELTLPDHGGDLGWAQRTFGGAAEDWIDLSTGISPWPWPVPPVPARVWQRLPEVDDSPLRRAAAEFYGCALDHLLPVPGSQFAIDCLPRTVSPGVVAVPEPGFSEHRRAWAAAGHRVVDYGNLTALADLIESGAVLHAVVINPNNPTCERADSAQLLQWRERLAGRGGILLVDEAFADSQPHLSLAAYTCLPNLVVLRSLGKFFGLAGVRLGFILATPALLAAVARRSVAWQINHPAQWLGEQALRDRPWQTMQRHRIAEHAAQFHLVLRDIFAGAHIQNAGLFLTVTHPGAALYPRFIQFAEAQVLLRFGRSGAGEWLRFALPGDGLAELRRRLPRLNKVGEPK